jgi:hypothetical protein
VTIRLSILAAAMVACAGAPACGQFAGDCSGGVYTDGACINTQPAVHWTDAKATAAARRFTFAPMVKGRWTNVGCKIIARYPAYEATSLCRGVFAAPGKAPRRVVARFSLSGIGAVNPDCSLRWETSPYCLGRNRTITTSDG